MRPFCLALVATLFTALAPAQPAAQAQDATEQAILAAINQSLPAAERLLERNGFRIEDRQVTGRWTLVVDGEPVQVTCRADLLVRRRRRRFVAEVKSGELGARATAPATRRQLLEYRTVFAVDGVLLVDMVHGTIHEVSFPEHER